MNRLSISAALLAACLVLPFAPISAQPAAAPASSAPGSTEKVADGLIVRLSDGWLKLQPRAANIVRVAVAKDRAFFDRQSLVALPVTQAPTWTTEDSQGAVVLKTAALQVRVDTQTGAVAFLDSTGKPIVRELDRHIEPAIVQGENTNHIEQQWEPSADESLYGLGQHQLDAVDIKNYDVDMWQHNGTVIVPYLVSSHGYGIFWDNLSYTRFGDLRPWQPLPTEQLTDLDGKSGAVTATYFADATFSHELFRNRAEDIAVNVPIGETLANTAFHPGLPPKGPMAIRWEGSFNAETPGVYSFQEYASNGVKIWIDDKLIIHEWYQNWLPYARQAQVSLTAGQHHIKVEWLRDAGADTMQLRWKTPAAARPTTLWSEVADGIDYTFVYGPQLDRVVAGFRTITGQATMMPEWIFGLWQSRQRYETQQQSLDVVKEFRQRKIPFDNIVQDWFYWRKAEWGSHQFDPERFPDPQGWVNAVHDLHAHIMISVWGKFYPGTSNYEALHKRGFLYEPLLWEDVHEWVGFPYTDYDAFNPAARKLFWSQVSRELFTKHFDAWWMDATEPDISSPMTLSLQKARMNPTAMGAGSRVLNGYALMNSRGVYEGQRGDAPNQRVFILTRSGFAGIQRYASATWSGDMPCTWESLQRQIPAALGFSVAGLPYWSMDIGGFTAPPRFITEGGEKLSGAALDEWCELNARWFEFGTFVPLTRLHGESQYREPWAFGGDDSATFKTIVKFDHLRYQLMPYIYSVAGAVTQDGAIFMRPLVMDFPGDAQARECADEYVFGPSLLVAPITEYKARSRSVYLPAAAGGWYDFWSGAHAAGGGAQTVNAAYDSIPLFVRAGSIVPFGPDLQYTQEKPADPITLQVYAGADGSFSLYEDDGLTYDYEHGAFTRIPFHWNDATQTLTIGARAGSFPGMLQSRTFKVVLVSPDHASGYEAPAQPARTVTYSGAAVDVVLK